MRRKGAGLTAATLIASAYDDEPVAYDKYPDCRQKVEEVMAAGGKVLFGVDATKAACFELCAQQSPTGKLDAVMFHFPHTGDKQHFHWNPGPEVIQRSIDNNAGLLAGFFHALRDNPGTRNSRVFVTLKKNQPYQFWDLVGGARSSGWVLVNEVPFRAEYFPRYKHRRTLPTRDAAGKPKTAEGVKMKDAHTHEFRYSYQELKPYPAPEGWAPVPPVPIPTPPLNPAASYMEALEAEFDAQDTDGEPAAKRPKTLT